MRRILAAATVMMVLSACSVSGGSAARGGQRPVDQAKGDGVINQLAVALGLESFGSCDDVLAYLHDNALDQVTAWGLGGGWGPVLFEGMNRAGTAVDSAEVPSQAYSTTNLQEIGVDEPDMVKTDGRILVALAQGKLFVVDVSGEPTLLGELDLAEVAPTSLFLSGDRVIVIGSAPSPVAMNWLARADEDAVVPDAMPDSMNEGVAMERVDWWWNPMTTLVDVDLSDPSKPSEISRLTIEGTVVASRMIDASIRLVVSSNPQRLAFVTPDQVVSQFPAWRQNGPGAWESAERIALSQNRSIVSNSTIEDWFPSYMIEDRQGLSSVEELPLVDCGQIAHPEFFSGLGITSIMTFDVNSGLQPLDSFGLVSDSQTVYASANAIYVATQQWRDWSTVPEGEWDRIAGITTTTIHRFDSTDPSRVSYTGAGEVLGWLYSQWAMSEKDGLLRVASTTQNPFWGFREGTTQSLVTVLEPTEARLETVGQVNGLGYDEQIYAVRFVGDAGYVVTYRQVDPLFVIDLSDPTSPQVAGELKIPGYSAYLHPIGDGLLLGVGQDGDAQGRVLGTQVAVFDVSDPTNPTQIDKLTLPGAYSGAEWDHHAFLYWPETQTVVIPVQQSQGDRWWSGALAVKANADGVRSLAEIEQPGYVYRTLVVGHNLLTLSDIGIQSNDLESFEENGWVGF